MNDSEFDERLVRLIAKLDETATLLRDHGETHWLGWVTRCRSELATYDAAAFDHVLGAFGGMGSLNDLLILGANGHVVRRVEESAVNDQLADLRGAIWDDATALRHDLRESFQHQHQHQTGASPCPLTRVTAHQRITESYESLGR